MANLTTPRLCPEGRYTAFDRSARDEQSTAFREETEPDPLRACLALAAIAGSIASVLPHVRDGSLRALATTSLRRSPAAPDVPPLDELGFHGFEANA
ncbi:tripartite tricarboxylate transporter substrate-binding protein [Bradyrhizobium sp. 5.13L]